MVLFSRFTREVAEKIAIDPEREAQEMEGIEYIVSQAHLVVSKLKKGDIMGDPEELKEKLAEIKDVRCRELIYALFRLSILAAPAGSFITLNADKISALLSDYGFTG